MGTPPTLTQAVFALAVALAEGPRHGYALIHEVEELTQGVVRLGAGTLYRSLQRMRIDGLIEELHDAPTAGGDERRRSYRLTSAGRHAAQREAARLSILVNAAASRGLTHPTDSPNQESP